MMLNLLVLAVSVATVTGLAYNAVCDTDDDLCDFHGNAVCKIIDPCLKGSCVCDDKYVYYSTNNECRPVNKKVGESCVMNHECEGEYVECTASVCACSEGFVAENDAKGCRFKSDLKKIGEACTYVDDCAAAKYVMERRHEGKMPEAYTITLDCTNSVCTCITGFSANGDGDKCEPNGLRAPGESCTTDAQCDSATYYETVCSGGSCGCQAGYSLFDGWDVYIRFEQSCFPSNSVMNIKKGELCGSSVSSGETQCDKGMRCSSCPEAPGTEICMDGVGRTGSGILLLCVCLLSLIL